MRSLYHTIAIGVLALLMSATSAAADASSAGGVAVAVNALGGITDYPVLTRGQVVLVNAQRLVVTREPLPVAKVAQAPPEPHVAEVEANRPPKPRAGAIWVAGHWIYGPTGFSWLAGRYIASRPGHVFVPPRWAELEEQYFYFTGFYVPYGVYVRSHFNRYYFSGTPQTGSRTTHGPYWPVGAPTRANSALTSASARDPYWPIGAKR